MSENNLEGCWRLVSYEFRSSDGRVFHPWGEDPIGVVIFDDNGHFSAQIMRRNRPIFTSETPTAEETKPAYEGYMAYFGRYEIVPEKNMLINHVEGALNPSWVGGKQIRYFEISGNRVTLRTDPINRGGTVVTGTLVWEKM